MCPLFFCRLHLMGYFFLIQIYPVGKRKTKPQHHWQQSLTTWVLHVPPALKRGSVMDLWYLCLHSHKTSLLLSIYTRDTEQDRRLLLYQTYIFSLSAVQGSQTGWHSFCAKGETFIPSLGPLIKRHRVLSSHLFLNHPLLAPKLFCNTEKLLYSFRRCLAVFQSWNIALLPVTFHPWDSTGRFCLHLTSVFTFSPS